VRRFLAGLLVGALALAGGVRLYVDHSPVCERAARRAWRRVRVLLAGAALSCTAAPERLEPLPARSVPAAWVAPRPAPDTASLPRCNGGRRFRPYLCGYRSAD
jgi:hypothetical protein